MVTDESLSGHPRSASNLIPHVLKPFVQQRRNGHPGRWDDSLVPILKRLPKCSPGFRFALAVQVTPRPTYVLVLRAPASVRPLEYRSFTHSWCPSLVSMERGVVR